ncbi:MAG: protein kinase [Polyangiaceae bacterium]
MTDRIRRRQTFSNLAEGSTFAQDFRVVRPLSTGGMGALYVVDQLSTKKRRALKVMRPEFVANEVLRRRFLQEARVSADIESDHVVEVIAAGVDEASGIPWLAMELLTGYDLEAFARRHAPLSPAVLTTLFEQLCHALGNAHDRRIIHRDLKPENVFLARPRRADAPFTVKVLDFGIAKVLAEAKTHTTDAVGTPLWMSPEQTSPTATIAPSSDVWALGLIAFRLVTGKIYWLAAHHPEISAVMAMRETLIDPLVSASERARALDCVAPPPGFDAWFARCVVRDPALRFADARAAFEGLRAALGPAADGPRPAFSFPPQSAIDDPMSNAPTEVDPIRVASGEAKSSTLEGSASLKTGLATLGSGRGRFWVSVGLVAGVGIAAVTALLVGLGARRKPTPSAARVQPFHERVMLDRPTAYFRFADGTATDLVGGVEGTFVGPHAEGPSVFPADRGALFSGGHLEIPAEGLAVSAGPFSIEAWIRADKLDDQHRGVIDVESVEAKVYEGYRMYLTRDVGRPGLKFGRVEGPNKYDVLADYPDDGAFHHVVATYDGASRTCIHVDAKATCADRGARVELRPPPTIYVADRAPGLGRGDIRPAAGESSPGAFFGVIDDLALYDRALDAREVRAHFDARDGR